MRMSRRIGLIGGDGYFGGSGGSGGVGFGEISILSETQYEQGKKSSSFGNRHLVGASHYSNSLYNRYNLWMRYELSIPRYCREISFKAWYDFAMNSSSIVRQSSFKYSIGSSNSPGQYTTFRWDTNNHKMSGKVTGEFHAGTTVYLWLHYDYAGNNVCYVEGVSLYDVIGSL